MTIDTFDRYIYKYDSISEHPSNGVGQPLLNAWASSIFGGEPLQSDIAPYGRDILVAEYSNGSWPSMDAFFERNPSGSENFTLRKKAGEIIMNPYSVKNVKITYFPIDEETSTTSSMTRGWYNRNSHQDQVLFGDTWPQHPEYPTHPMYIILRHVWTTQSRKHPLQLGYPFSTTPYPVPSMMSSVITDAYAKANSGEWDVLTTMAELKSTLSWVLSALKRAATIIHGAKRKAKTSLTRTGDSGSSLWLEYRYALLPIIFDLENIGEAARAASRQYAFFQSTETPTISEVTASGDWQHDESLVVRHRAYIRRAYDPEQVLAQLGKSISANPFVTGWELVPWSFVIDWFVNVGDYIAALSSPSFHCDEGAVYSIKIDRYITSTYKDKNAAVLTEDSYYRFPITNSDISLTFDVDIDFRRMIDAFALSWQQTRQLFKKKRGK
jgi:hypothetical protein